MEKLEYWIQKRQDLISTANDIEQMLNHEQRLNFEGFAIALLEQSKRLIDDVIARIEANKGAPYSQEEWDNALGIGERFSRLKSVFTSLYSASEYAANGEPGYAFTSLYESDQHNRVARLLDKPVPSQEESEESPQEEV